VEALGNPLKPILTSGAAGDNPRAIPLRAGQQTREVLADRGYAADATAAGIAEQVPATATSPPKQRRLEPRPCDQAAYEARQRIACFIGKLQYFRRIFSRFDKYATRFLAFIHFASTRIRLR